VRGCGEGVLRRAARAGGAAEAGAPRVTRRLLFTAGGVELHVGVEDPFAPARKAHPGFVVGDLEALRARLAAAGVAIRDDDALPGAVRFYADDPFGNRLEFREVGGLARV